MGLVGCISLSNLKGFSQNTRALSELKLNDQIWTFGNRMVKVPAKAIDPMQNAFLKTINKIIAYALKIIYAIGRFLTGQNEDSNIGKLEKLSDRILTEIGKELSLNKVKQFPVAEREYYDALERLGEIEKHLKKATSGLNNFKKGCETGAVHLIPPSSKILNERAERVEKIIDKIKNEVVPKLSNKISDIEKTIHANDYSKVLSICQLIYSKDEIKIDNLDKMNISSVSFREFAEKDYGQPLVSRVLNYYGLENRHCLTGLDVAALFVGMTTNITMNDLQHIYQSESTCELAPFSSLSTQEVCKLLSDVRNINFECITAKKNYKYIPQLNHDKLMLSTVADYKEFSGSPEYEMLPAKPLRKHAYTEFLSRHMAYALYDTNNVQFPDGILFPMYDRKDQLTLKEAHHLVAEKGLFGALVKPALLHHCSDKKVPIQVVYRGTFCKDSVMRDINTGNFFMNSFLKGPGKESFEKRQEGILEKIFVLTDSYSEQGRQVSIELMGHSLGGSDSQRTAEYLAFKLRSEPNHGIGGVKLFAYNSPNVEVEIAERFIESVPQAKTPFKLRYFDNHHDFVQEVGAKRLGYCGEKVQKPANLAVTIFKFNRPFPKKIAALAKNIFLKAKYFFLKCEEKHTFYAFKFHPSKSPHRYNNAYIQNIYTNNIKDVGIAYGEKLDQLSIETSKEDMDSLLLTNSGRLGRKLKKMHFDALHILSFGGWKHNYHPKHLSWKKEPVVT